MLEALHGEEEPLPARYFVALSLSEAETLRRVIEAANGHTVSGATLQVALVAPEPVLIGATAAGKTEDLVDAVDNEAAIQQAQYVELLKSSGYDDDVAVRKAKAMCLSLVFTLDAATQV